MSHCAWLKIVLYSVAKFRKKQNIGLPVKFDFKTMNNFCKIWNIPILKNYSLLSWNSYFLLFIYSHCIHCLSHFSSRPSPPEIHI
jgi:hypothetical protein